MINKLKKLTGIDRAIAYTIISKLIQATSGIISIIFIAKYLSKTEQGYYYTFASIIAIQIFFELGLSNIITQFTAHEMAFLKWTNSGNSLNGDPKALSRLSFLLKFCIRWYSVISLLLIIVLIIFGFYYFNKYSHFGVVSWQKPWIILCISTSLNLIISPILAFLEGLGLVRDIAKIRLIQQSAQLSMLFILFICGFGLMSSPITSIIVFLIVPISILLSNKVNILLNIWNFKGQFKVDYMSEIFPFQWKIALSWISGYFIFQLFNPIIFATSGPIIAGQMGMSLGALNGILAIALSWINTRVPFFSKFIARKDYSQLDKYFKSTIKSSSIACAFMLLFFVLLLLIIKYFNNIYSERFLSIRLILVLSLSTFFVQIIYALATYLRCHKQEPYLKHSIITAVITASSTICFAKFYGVEGVVFSYGIITLLLSFPWALRIFFKKKREWQN